MPDFDGRAEGRGAYLCTDPGCAERVASGGPLARSFRAPTNVRPETIDLLRRWQRNASTR